MMNDAHFIFTDNSLTACGRDDSKWHEVTFLLIVQKDGEEVKTPLHSLLVRT